YNPASRTRREQLERARDVLLRHRARDCPVVVARDVGGAGESVSVSTLGGFDAAQVDMRTLLVIGSTTTRVIGGAGGRALVYTPRSYPSSPRSHPS
ncbi:MAG: precorrin-2 C20-methyltransferase, partial [Actinomycetota bacterium]|nr:precorrin-2 C20-methyltransferase [Actinomycetota bacterium]